MAGSGYTDLREKLKSMLPYRDNPKGPRDPPAEPPPYERKRRYHEDSASEPSDYEEQQQQQQKEEEEEARKVKSGIRQLRLFSAEECAKIERLGALLRLQVPVQTHQGVGARPLPARQEGQRHGAQVTPRRPQNHGDVRPAGGRAFFLAPCGHAGSPGNGMMGLGVPGAAGGMIFWGDPIGEEMGSGVICSPGCPWGAPSPPLRDGDGGDAAQPPIWGCPRGGEMTLPKVTQPGAVLGLPNVSSFTPRHLPVGTWSPRAPRSRA
uniref:Uncharacterized protein n=1 Tax=Anas platyrhynchos platyrhynchos TaxID=8840 RepID=A0A493TT62_ANAPP